MNNKGFVKIVTVLLLLASIYQLSFTAVTKSVESKAEKAAKKVYTEDSPAKTAFISRLLDSMGQEEVYPGLGFTYQQCKENELNLGLDLQGGMNVTLEVETPAIIKAMAGDSKDEAFDQAYESAKSKFLGQENFVDVLAREYQTIAPEGKIAGIFYGRGLENELPNGYNSSN